MIRSAGWMLESMFLRLRVTIEVTCVLARASETRHSAVAIVRDSRADERRAVDAGQLERLPLGLVAVEVEEPDGPAARLAAVAEAREAGRRVAGALRPR